MIQTYWKPSNDQALGPLLVCRKTLCLLMALTIGLAMN